MTEANSIDPPRNGTSKMLPSDSKESPTYQIGASLYLEEQLSDIIINLNENGTVWRFPAHSIVLAAHSNFFKKMLFDEFAEKRTREIQLQDMSPETLKQFLRFLYIGDANLECWKEAVDLLKVGHKYLIEPLVQTCSQYLHKHVDLYNVCYIYRKTALFNVINLRDFCLDMIRSTACIVLRSHEFEFLDEDSVIDVISSASLNVDSEMCVVSAVLRWAATECCRRSKPITEKNISQMIIPFVEYLNTESITRDEFETLPQFMHTNKKVFPRQNFCVSQHLQNHANHVNFKIMDINNSINYNFQNLIFFTFNVDYPLFLIGVNLISVGYDLYNDDYVILHTKAASVTTTIFECCIQNGKHAVYPYINTNGTVMQKIEVLFDGSVLLQPHTMYQLGLRSDSSFFSKDGEKNEKPNATFAETGLFLMNEVGYSDSAPFTIHTDLFWGITKLLYLRAPVSGMTCLK